MPRLLHPLALAVIALPTAASGGNRPVQLEGWRIEGTQPGARLGASLATADVNGDGFGDLVVGAPGASLGAPREGRVFVYLGSSGGLAPFPDWTVRGWQAGANLGARVAAAGDVNGDGFDDIVVSAPGWDRHAGAPKVFATGRLGGHERYTTDEGAFLVFHGSPTGLGAIPARVVVGIERAEHVGSAIAGVGDVNGDGYDDIVMGATGKSDGLGGVFLFSGSATGTKPFPDWIRVGTVPSAGLGSMVAAAGDVNGDGYADFAAGEPTGLSCGRLMLFHGSPAGPAATPDRSYSESRVLPVVAANFDQTGLSEILYARSTSCSGSSANVLAWRRPGSTSSGTFSTYGPIGAVALGDVNGDGWTDWIASVPSFSHGPFQGRVFVYLNRPAAPFAPSGGYPHYDGDEEGAAFGAALAAIDVDGDGADEIFIAAPEAGDAEGAVVLQPGWHVEQTFVQTHSYASEEGVVADDFDQDGRDDLVTLWAGDQFRVRHGTATGPALAHQTLTLPAVQGNDFLLPHASTGDANGDGYPDLLLTHRAHIYWGHGGRFAETTQHTLYLGSAAGLSSSFVLNIPGGGTSEASFVGDVNGDGLDDVLELRSTGDLLRFGTAAGTGLTAPVQTLPAATTHGSDTLDLGGGRHRALHPCDLDGDAYGDFLVARLGPSSTPSLHAFHGSPAGLVAGAVHVPPELDMLYFYVAFLEVADIDADGYLEVVFESSDGTTTYRITPAGLERTPRWFESGRTSSFFLNSLNARADFDGDGRADLLMAGQHLHCGTATGLAREPIWFGDLGAVQPNYQRGGWDFDGDGRASLLVRTGSTLTVRELLP